MYFSVFRQLTPPTQVDHCLSCSFTAPGDNNLILARTSVLEIYTLNSSSEDDNGDERRSPLNLVGSYPLNGNIEAIASLKRPGSQTHSLLLTFRDAKLSMLEWDVANYTIKTVAAHFFEGDAAIYKDGRISYLNVPVVKVDPQNRCAAVLLYETHLVVLPVNQLNEEVKSGKLKIRTSSGASSYYYTIDLKAMGLRGIRDFIFLNGYFEPTVLVLHEPNPSWAGRMTLRKSTCVITAISLNMTQRLNPVIWEKTNLPFDCHNLIPCPQPVGGALVLSSNALLYVNQSSGHSLRVNDYAKLDDTTGLPGEDASVCLMLDNARFTFLAPDHVLISLRTGELYLINLFTDGRTVIKMEMSKLGASVLPSCMCTLDRHFFFIGSRLADSMVVRYSKADTSGQAAQATLEPAAKKLKVEKDPTEDTSDPLLADDKDEILYFEDKKNGSTIGAYNFKIEDSITNIGPIVSMVSAEAFNINAELQTPDGSAGRNLELVTASGHGKNGSLCVLQRSIRLDSLAKYDYEDANGVWSMFLGQQSSDVNYPAHSFVVVSRANNTEVLKVEATLETVPLTAKTGFKADTMSLTVAHVHSGSKIVQVFPTGVHIVGENLKMLSQVDYSKSNKRILAASVLDPYILLLLPDGSIRVFRIELNGGLTPIKKIAPRKADLHITAATLFLDEDGTTRSPFRPSEGANVAAPVEEEEIDEEDLMLYGDGEEKGEQHEKKEDRITNSYCILCRAGGSMEVYSVPGFELVFSCPDVIKTPPVLKDNFEDDDEDDGDENEDVKASASVSEVRILEVAVASIGQTCPYLLLALNNGDFIVYRSFHFVDPNNFFRSKQGDKRIPLRFRKLETNLDGAEVHVHPAPSADDSLAMEPRRQHFVPFYNVSGWSGVFICGKKPMWIFGDREYYRLHRMTVEGHVVGFSPFNNAGCPAGFIVVDSHGSLKVANLPSTFSYDFDWPLRKVHVKCTPHKLCYNEGYQMHLLAASQRLPVKEQNTAMRVPPIMSDRFELQLYLPGEWRRLDRIQFEEDEHIIDLKVVNVPGADGHGTIPLIVVGTGFAVNEETACRGNIVLFDLKQINVKSPSGEMVQEYRLKQVFKKYEKGPVAAISDLNGFIFVCIGQRILNYKWEAAKGQLVACSFIDSEIYPCVATTLRNYVLYGDAHRSVRFLRFKEDDGKQIVELGKDDNRLEVISGEFMVDGQQLSMLVSDSDKNAQVFAYVPGDPASQNGIRLLRKADFHVGSHIGCMLRQALLHYRTSDKSRTCVVFGTYDGAIGYFVPLEEKEFRRLNTLQTVLTNALPHHACLNPKAFRLYKSSGNRAFSRSKNIVDYELLKRFMDLGHERRKELAREIGTKPDQIIKNMTDIDSDTDFF